MLFQEQMGPCEGLDLEDREAEAQHVNISSTQLAPVLICGVCNLDPRHYFIIITITTTIIILSSSEDMIIDFREMGREG